MNLHEQLPVGTKVRLRNGEVQIISKSFALGYQAGGRLYRTNGDYELKLFQSNTSTQKDYLRQFDIVGVATLVKKNSSPRFLVGFGAPQRKYPYTYTFTITVNGVLVGWLHQRPGEKRIEPRPGYESIVRSDAFTRRTSAEARSTTRKRIVRALERQEKLINTILRGVF